ncbi:MAG: proliferating cell nuclear antigen (pcna) [Desulfurococcaceae archaeon]
MRLKFREATVWKYAIVAISKIIEEASFKINEEGVRLRAMDPSGVALVDFYIPHNAFYEFDVSNEVNIGVNMDELAKVLRRARKGDELVLEMTQLGKLGVYLEGRGSRRFMLPSIELSYQEIPEISFEESFKCKILPKLFKDIVKELEAISDAIELYAPENSDALYFKAESEIAEAEIVLSSASGALIEYESTKEARSKYTIDYLSDIVTASQAAETLSLGFGNETPLKMIYELPGGGTLQFYVAPRTD